MIMFSCLLFSPISVISVILIKMYCTGSLLNSLTHKHLGITLLHKSIKSQIKTGLWLGKQLHMVGYVAEKILRVTFSCTLVLNSVGLNESSVYDPLIYID